MAWYEWISSHFYEGLVLFLLIRYRNKMIFIPLAGGNGHLQVDELAKGVLLVAFGFSVKAEIERVTQWQVFPDSYWYALLGAVILIAGLKEGKMLFEKIKKPADTAPQQVL